MKAPDRITYSGPQSLLRYGPELRHFVLRRMRGPDAEDVIQEVFLRLLRLPNPDFIKNPRAYICGVALHVVREFRMRASKSGNPVDPLDLVELAERPLAAQTDELETQLEIRQRIERALLRLPTAHRTVFLLYHRDGYSYEEIATQLGISTHTVDKYLLQAKVKFRAMEWEP